MRERTSSPLLPGDHESLRRWGGNHGRKLGGRLFSAFLVSSFGVFSWNLDKVKGISTFTILDRRA